MEDRTVGLLDPVDPATAWNSEPGDFVPWALAAAQPAARLGDALGLDLEPVAREAPVGRFRADIVCRDRHSRWRGGDRGAARHLRPQPSRPAPDLCGRARRRCRRLARHEVPRRAPLRGRPAEPGRRSRATLFRRGDRFVEDRRFAQARRNLPCSRRPANGPAPAAGTPGHRPAPAEADAARAGSAGRPPLGDSPIRSRRLSRGLSLKQVAKAAGLSRACVAHIETEGGTRVRPRRWPPSNTR